MKHHKNTFIILTLVYKDKQNFKNVSMCRQWKHYVQWIFIFDSRIGGHLGYLSSPFFKQMCKMQTMQILLLYNIT